MAENEEGLTLPIYSRNPQWAVTGYGMECCDLSEGRYEIQASSLGWMQDDFLGWPLQMAGKKWVNIDLFMQAFTIALQVHAEKYGSKPSEGCLRATKKEAERQVAASKRFDAKMKAYLDERDAKDIAREPQKSRTVSAAELTAIEED